MHPFLRIAALRYPATVLLVLGLYGCGGREAAEPEGEGGQSTESLPLDICRSDLLELGYEFQEGSPHYTDFESGTPIGYWLSIDGSPNARVIDGRGESSPIVNPNPEGGRAPIPSEFEGRACRHLDGSEDVEGSYALHVVGEGLDDWGISITQDFLSDPLNGTEWDGLSFWVRRGPGAVGRSMLAAITEWHTRNPDNDDPARRDDEDGFCEDYDNIVELKCDRFGVGVGMEEQWRFVAIPFSSMNQQGFGAQAPCAYVSQILGVAFQVSTGSWDLWIDDVAFYRAPEGERPPSVECDDARGSNTE